MKTQKQIASWLAIVTTPVATGYATMHKLPAWVARLWEIDTFLVAFTLTGMAILLWPRNELTPAKR